MSRLLLLNTDLQIGGTPTVVRELALRLREWNEVDVASLKTVGPIGRQLQKEGVTVAELGARSPLDLPRARGELVRLIQSRRYQTVFSFLVHANALAALSRRKCPEVSRWIQSIQTTQSRPRWHWSIQRIASRSADAVIVPSESVAQMAQQRCAIEREHIHVIPNAIDIERFASLRHDVFDLTIQNLVFVGRLDPIKRIDVLIQAIALLPQSFQLEIWGEGSQRGSLESLVRKLNLAQRVKFQGQTTDLDTVYRHADLLVLPSDAEGFGLVLIEAMAASVPVVATDVPGIRDVVKDHENGLLVPPGHAPALAQAITTISTSVELRDRMIQNGLQRVRESYAWEEVIQRYRSIIE